MKKIFSRLLVILLLFLFFFIFSAFSYANNVSEDLANSVFRLHVIANSDSTVDQDLKYQVRDNVLNYMNNLCSNCKTKNEAMEIAKNHSDDFRNIAQKTVEDNGFDYNVNVIIGNYSFPTKKYGDILLPSGNYDALRIEIGEAKGKNWWCVMFPPLCFVDISSGIVPEESKETLENNIPNTEEYILINENKSNEIKLKFKLVELFQNVKVKIAQK